MNKPSSFMPYLGLAIIAPAIMALSWGHHALPVQAQDAAPPRPAYSTGTASSPARASQAPAMPNPKLTPGVVRTTSAAEICATGTANQRHWTRERDNKILRLYGLPEGPHPLYEIDHLVPLGIGGADDDANLWPQPRAAFNPANQDSAEKKDRLEWRMRDMICHPVTKDGNWSPALLQKEIAADWLAAYAKYMQPH